MADFVIDSETPDNLLSIDWSGNTELIITNLTGLTIVITAPVGWTGSENVTFTVGDGEAYSSDTVEVIVNEGPGWK